MNLRRSSMRLHSFQGTFALPQKARLCNPCVRNEVGLHRATCEGPSKRRGTAAFRRYRAAFTIPPPRLGWPHRGAGARPTFTIPCCAGRHQRLVLRPTPEGRRGCIQSPDRGANEQTSWRPHHLGAHIIRPQRRRDNQPLCPRNSVGSAYQQDAGARSRLSLPAANLQYMLA